MSTLLLLTKALQPSAEVLPALALLGHQVKILPAEGSALLEAPDSDLLLVDGRQDLAHAVVVLGDQHTDSGLGLHHV